MFKKRSSTLNAIANVDEVDMTPFKAPAPIYSSIGDLGRLGLLEEFRPSSQKKTLTVDEVDFSLRNPMPCPYNVFFEYDGRFHLRIAIGKNFAFEGEMEIRERVVRELFDVLF